jgi:hypothetical protein
VAFKIEEDTVLSIGFRVEVRVTYYPNAGSGAKRELVYWWTSQTGANPGPPTSSYEPGADMRDVPMGVAPTGNIVNVCLDWWSDSINKWGDVGTNPRIYKVWLSVESPRCTSWPSCYYFYRDVEVWWDTVRMVTTIWDHIRIINPTSTDLNIEILLARPDGTVIPSGVYTSPNLPYPELVSLFIWVNGNLHTRYAFMNGPGARQVMLTQPTSKVSLPAGGIANLGIILYTTPPSVDLARTNNPYSLRSELYLEEPVLLLLRVYDANTNTLLEERQIWLLVPHITWKSNYNPQP